MKIYDKEEFMNLPPSVFYYQYESCGEEDYTLNIKQNTIKNDNGVNVGCLRIVIATPLFEMNPINELFEGKSVPLDYLIWKDERIGDKDLFIVLERDDLMQLAVHLTKAIGLYNEGKM